MTNRHDSLRAAFARAQVKTSAGEAGGKKETIMRDTTEVVDYDHLPPLEINGIGTDELRKLSEAFAGLAADKSLSTEAVALLVNLDIHLHDAAVAREYFAD